MASTCSSGNLRRDGIVIECVEMCYRSSALCQKRYVFNVLSNSGIQPDATEGHGTGRVFVAA